MKNKHILLPSLILLIILGLYNVIYFLVPFDRSQISLWITYIFTYVFSLLALLTIVITFSKEKLETKVFSLSLVKKGFATLLLQLILDIVLMITVKYYAFKLWQVLIVELVILFILVITLLIGNKYIDSTQNQEAKVEKQTDFIDELRVETSSLVSQTKDKPFAKVVYKLQQKAQYTDPVSTKEVFDIETAILEAIDKLNKHIQNDNKMEVENAVNKAIELLTEREIKLKSLRK